MREESKKENMTMQNQNQNQNQNKNKMNKSNHSKEFHNLYMILLTQLSIFFGAFISLFIVASGVSVLPLMGSIITAYIFIVFIYYVVIKEVLTADPKTKGTTVELLQEAYFILGSMLQSLSIGLFSTNHANGVPMYVVVMFVVSIVMLVTYLGMVLYNIYSRKRTSVVDAQN